MLKWSWAGSILAILLCVMAGDLRWRRVQNDVVLTLLAAACALWGIGAGPAFVGPAFLAGCEAASLFGCLYALGWLGAGDVKLSLALGALVGPAQLVPWLFVSALCAGLLSAISLLIWSNLSPDVMIKRCLTPQHALQRGRRHQETVPLAVALCVGALCVAQGGQVWCVP